MADPFNPPYLQAQVNQNVGVGAEPEFGTVTVGDASTTITGDAYVNLQKYDGGTLHSWRISGDSTSITISRTAPTLSPIMYLTDTAINAVPSMVVYDDTECTGMNTGSMQTSGGLWAAKTIRTASDVQSLTSRLVSGNVTVLHEAGTTLTDGAVSSNAVTIPTSTNYVYFLRVVALCTKTDGENASISFDAKAKNTAGTITTEAPTMYSSVIPTDLLGVSVALSFLTSSLYVTVTGRVSATLRWGVNVDITSIPFSW